MKVIALLLLILLLSGCGKNGNPPTQEEMEETQAAVNDLLEEIDQDYKVRGSCNTIDDKSHCVDYIGSFWTEEQMKLNCGSEGTFSTNTCPYGAHGGCQSGGGTMVEIVAWSYNHGGQPVSSEEAAMQAKVCNTTMNTAWVTQDQLFLK